MIKRSWLVALLIVLIGLTGSVAGPTEANAQNPSPWTSCPANRPQDSLVRTFPVNQRMNYYLRCGNTQKGVRHIVPRHRNDFQRVAAGTGLTWVAVADLAMETIARDPDRAIPAGGGKACLSRVVFLRDSRTNQIVRTQVFRMIVIVSTGEVVTAYPTGKQCQPGDAGE